MHWPRNGIIFLKYFCFCLVPPLFFGLSQNGTYIFLSKLWGFFLRIFINLTVFYFSWDEENGGGCFGCARAILLDCWQTESVKVKFYLKFSAAAFVVFREQTTTETIMK